MKKGQNLNSVREKKHQIRSSFIRNIMEQALLKIFSFFVILTNTEVHSTTKRCMLMYPGPCVLHAIADPPLLNSS